MAVAFRVLAADTTPVFREGLRTVVQRTVGLEWVGGTDHPDVVRDGVRTTRPHVVVIDSAIDPRGALTQDLVAADPKLTVALVFREHDHTPASVLVAQAAGARCLLSRDTDAGVMARAILHTHPARRYVDPRLVLALSVSGSGASRNEVLTSRRRQILALVAEGWTERDIARNLDITVNTVRTHMTEIRRRLGARDRAHAVAMGYRTGLLPLSHAVSAST